MNIRYKFETEINASDDDPEGYTDEIGGEIFELSDDSDNEAPIGRVVLRLIHLGRATNEHFPLYDVFDAMDDTQLEVGRAICAFGKKRRTDGIRDSLAIDNRCGDVLFVKGMELLPKFRGHGLGLWILQSVIDTFGGGCSITVIEPHPINYSKVPPNAWVAAMKPDELPAEIDKGATALRQHWARLGFKPVPRTKKKFWYLSMEVVNPRLPSAFFEEVHSRLYPEPLEP